MALFFEIMIQSRKEQELVLTSSVKAYTLPSKYNARNLIAGTRKIYGSFHDVLPRYHNTHLKPKENLV